MEYFAGLDVAMKETAICVVDAEGKTIIEGKALSEPDAIADFLHPFRDKLKGRSAQLAAQYQPRPVPPPNWRP